MYLSNTSLSEEILLPEPSVVNESFNNVFVSFSLKDFSRSSFSVDVSCATVTICDEDDSASLTLSSVSASQHIPSSST